MEPLIEHIRRKINLSVQDAEKIMSFFTRIKPVKKTFLLKEGNICKELFFVEKGCLRLFFIDEKGREQITHFAIENWWLTDYLAFQNKATAAFNIQTIEDSTLLRISYEELIALTDAVPVTDRYLRINLQTAFGAAQRRILMMFENSKEAMVQQFINSHPEFVQRVPQYMLASFLGLTPEYLSEIRKRYSNTF